MPQADIDRLREAATAEGRSISEYIRERILDRQVTAAQRQSPTTEGVSRKPHKLESRSNTGSPNQIPPKPEMTLLPVPITGEFWMDYSARLDRWVREQGGRWREAQDIAQAELAEYRQKTKA